MSWSRRGLRARIVLVVLVGMIGPMAILTWAAWASLSELHRELVAERQRLGKSVADHLEYAIRSDLEALQTIGASGPRSPDATDPGSERAAVREAWLRSRFLESVALLGEGGAILAEEPPRLRHASLRLDLPIVHDVFRAGRPDVSDLVDEGDGRRRIYLLVPLRSWEGKVVRVATGVVDPASDRFTSLLQPFRVGERGSTDLLDRRGVVIATTDPSRRWARSNAHDVLALAPLSVVPWRIAIRQPEEETLALRAPRRRLVLLGPVVLAVGLLFAWGAAWSIRKPIGVLTDAAERIAAGDLAQPIPPLGEDEVGRLGRSLERMRATLRESLEAIARANLDLERRVDERTRELARVNRELSARERSRGELLRKVISAQEEERKRVARELHDETSQSLTAVVMSLEAMLTARAAGDLRQRLTEIRGIAVSALDEVHRLLHDLRPSVLDDLGLTSAIRWCAERHLEPLGIAVRCEFAGLEDRLPPETETALFRVVQEAITNIAKHAEAETVLIQGAARDGTVAIEIEDDGKGFDPERVTQDRATGTGLGLTGMRERVELLGGTLTVESTPAQGTRIAFAVPLPAESRDG